MKKFEEITKEKVSKVESDILAYWKSIDILNASIKNREGKETFVFYDGPATANPIPLKRYIV